MLYSAFMRTLLLTSTLLCTGAASALAQRVVAYDTLGGGPSAVTCGFCAGERFGVVFRELPPPARGLEPGDFPLELRGVRVALANAVVSGGVCAGGTTGGTATVDLEIYAGSTPPTGDLRDRPTDAPWEGETLLWAGVGLPLVRSSLDGEGSTTFVVSFNDLQIRGEMDEPLVVEAPHRYLRVVFTLGEEAHRNRAGCEDAGLVSPTAFPMRDDDGVVAPERSFLWGQGGLGWQWNEAVGVNGDWAVRAEIRPLETGTPDAGIDAGTDAGNGSLDASAETDGGAPMDTGTDAGAAPSEDESSGAGCGACAAHAGRGLDVTALLAFVVLGRRRHRP